MRKHIRLIFLTALLTGSGIAAFQLFWLYKTYTITKNNFYTTAANLLQKSIDDHMAVQRNIQVPATLEQMEKDMHLEITATHTIVMPDKASAADSAAARLPDDINRSLDSMQKVVMDSVRKNIMKTVKLMVNPPANIDTIQRIYRKQLAQKSIHLPVQLTKDTLNKTVNPQEITGIITASCNETLIKATFSGVTAWLLWQNAWPIGISLSLILLTGCCLWYMLYMIRRQHRLDTMKNDFINNMTHELRTPVSILRSTHEAIDHFGYIDDKERTLRYLQANRQVIDMMDQNIDRILKIAQYENTVTAVSPETINLKTLIEKVIQRFPQEDGNTIQLYYALPQEAITIDPNIFETIASNLIDNALKYAEGAVQVTVSLLPAAKGMLLEVKDNGMGIAPAHIPYIFDKFYRVPTGNIHNVKGYGIGLSYVKTLTSCIGGVITVKSKPGEGTTFSIKFPLS